MIMRTSYSTATVSYAAAQALLNRLIERASASLGSTPDDPLSSDPVSAVVLNREGVVVAAVTQDGARPAAVGNAYNKAFTALNLREPSGYLAGLSGSPFSPTDFGDLRYSAFPGGVPLRNVAGDVIGALGVGGRNVNQSVAGMIAQQRGLSFAIPEQDEELALDAASFLLELEKQP